MEPIYWAIFAGVLAILSLVYAWAYLRLKKKLAFIPVEKMIEKVYLRMVDHQIGKERLSEIDAAIKALNEFYGRPVLTEKDKATPLARLYTDYMVEKGYLLFPREVKELWPLYEKRMASQFSTVIGHNDLDDSVFLTDEEFDKKYPIRNK